MVDGFNNYPADINSIMYYHDIWTVLIEYIAVYSKNNVYVSVAMGDDRWWSDDW
jgi:hypothetical protein